MKRFIPLLLLPCIASAQTIGSGVTIGRGVTVGAPFTSVVTSGIVYAPPAQHFASTQSVALSYPADATATLFYTTNGYDVSPASTLYASNLSLSTTTTVNALAYLSGTVRQGTDRSTSGWKTVLDPVNSNSPWVVTGNCPNKSLGGGVANVIDDCEFDTTALGNTALHLSFTTSATGTAQRQVLWTMTGGSCDSCTEITQSFDIQPAENPSNVWAFENDMQNWDSTRGLELTCGLQYLQGNGTNMWQVSGQSGWTSSGVGMGGPLPTGVFTHVETHCHRIIGLNACTFGGSPIECVYYDWISINGVKTTLNKTFPAHPLPATWAGGCYNQTQLDTTHAGTVGVYIRAKNMTCGYGTQSTGTAVYTTP